MPSIPAALRDLGLPQGVPLLVHASLRSLGPVDGGAETVVQGLLEAVGDQGTLLMPALSYETVSADNPVFDALTTPSCVGALPEYFRTRPGTLRSVHPTHSVCAAGYLAEEIIAGHELDTTPCGPHSPFHRLPQYDGWILMLGCGLKPNTSMHAVEELVEPPYLFKEPADYETTRADGVRTPMTVRQHDFSGWAQRYDRIACLLTPDELRVGPVLKARVQLINARALWREARAALERDPLFFVQKVEG
jgi:aminoglycoside 3-N-acetyltransferase